MVTLKTNEEIALMQEGGKILNEILTALAASVKPGMTTNDIDRQARALLADRGAKASFLHYNRFPAAICLSVNEEIVHGVPSDRVLKSGDVLKLDFGVLYKGFHTDSAKTIIVGNVADKNKQKLIAVTEYALDLGVAQARAGNTLGDIGHAVQAYVESEGFNVVRDLVGHGIGRTVHEEPEVLNYGKTGTGMKLVAGMVIAIEPMVVEGTWQIAEGRDGFSYLTKDNELAAHAEHTVAITEEGPLILTK